jgi:hypothetical protein
MSTTERVVLTQRDIALLNEYVDGWEDMGADVLSENLANVKQALYEFYENQEQREAVNAAVAQARRAAHPDMRHQDDFRAAQVPNYGVRPGEQAANVAGKFSHDVAQAEQLAAPVLIPIDKASKKAVGWFGQLLYLITAILALLAIGAVTGIISHDTAAYYKAHIMQLIGRTTLARGEELHMEWDGKFVTQETRDACLPVFYAVDETGTIQAPPSLWPEDQQEALQDKLYEGCHVQSTPGSVIGYVEGEGKQLWAIIHMPKTGVKKANKHDLNDWVDVWTASDWWGIDAESVMQMPGTADLTPLIGKNLSEGNINLLQMGKRYDKPAAVGELPTAAIVQPTTGAPPTFPPRPPSKSDQPSAPPSAPAGGGAEEPAATQAPEPPADTPVPSEPPTQPPAFATQTTVPLPTATNTPWPTSPPVAASDYQAADPNAACGVYVTCLGGRPNKNDPTPAQGVPDGTDPLSAPPTATQAPIIIIATDPPAGTPKRAHNGAPLSEECNALVWQYDNDLRKTSGADTMKLANCQSHGTVN